MRKKRIVYNILSGFGGKIVTIILSLVVPRLMLVNYGSEVSGLFTTLSNIYSYLAIIEAGIATSAIQLLYKPVMENDRNKINSILYTTKKYFHRCGYLYAVGVVILTIVLPITLHSSINGGYIALIALLQGAASLINFFIIAGMTSLLSAEGKDYVTNNITLFISILTNIAKIVLVSMQVNIVLLQAAYFGISLTSTALYYFYFKCKYPWINRKSGDDSQRLPQRGSFMIHNIIYLIFNNTDTIIISFFCGLKVASVYAIYNMIFSNVLGLVNTLFNSMKFTLGQTYNADKNKYIVLHDTYKSYYCCFVFSVVTVIYILITPFIKLYTEGVTDIQYVDSYLPMLFCLVSLLSSCRSTESNLVNLTFHAKQTLWRAGLEAVINLGISLVLIQFIGIYGCLLGTIIALLYRTNDFIIYANRKILNRNPVQAYITVISNFLVFFIAVGICNRVNIIIMNYFEFCIYGFCLMVFMLTVYFIVNSLTNLNGFRFVYKNVCSMLKH